MSAAMQLKWTPEVEAPDTVLPPGPAEDRQPDPRQLAILETILEDYRPVFRELASR